MVLFTLSNFIFCARERAGLTGSQHKLRCEKREKKKKVDGKEFFYQVGDG